MRVAITAGQGVRRCNGNEQVNQYIRDSYRLAEDGSGGGWLVRERGGRGGAAGAGGFQPRGGDLPALLSPPTLLQRPPRGRHRRDLPNSSRCPPITRKSLITREPSAIAHARSDSTGPSHGRPAAAAALPTAGRQAWSPPKFELRRRRGGCSSH
jgi:hypothetical protein